MADPSIFLVCRFCKIRESMRLSVLYFWHYIFSLWHVVFLFLQDVNILLYLDKKPSSTLFYRYAEMLFDSRYICKGDLTLCFYFLTEQSVIKSFCMPRVPRFVNWGWCKIAAVKGPAQSFFEASDAEESIRHSDCLPDCISNHVPFPTIAVAATSFVSTRCCIGSAVGADGGHWAASLFSSISRRMRSDTVIPKSLARFCNHLSWGSVRTIDVRVLIDTQLAYHNGVVN